MSFECSICGMKFPSKRSLSSHRSWHTGKLQAWKDIAKVRYIGDSKTWKSKGKKLIRQFLFSVLSLKLSKKKTEALIDKIWKDIDKALRE